MPFHIVKQYIIFSKSAIFDDKTLGNNLLNSSRMNNDLFDSIDDSRSIIPIYRFLTRSMNSPPDSIVGQSTLTLEVNSLTS